MQTPFRFLVTAGVLIVLAPTVYAQTGQTGVTSGGSGLGTTGSSSTGSSATGQSAAGGSGLSGESSFGGTVPGQSTAISNAAQSFIGANATQGFIGGATRATNQQGNNRQFQAIQNNLSQQNASQQIGTPREVRTTLRVSFAYPTALQSQMTGRLANANVASLSRFVSCRPELAGVSVTLQPDGAAVLTGSVPSAETSRLAANLIRLQPGVRKVDNQIALPVN